MERSVRAADLPCNWFFVRPVNIWGPWHNRYKQEFWRTVKQGLYFHPGGRPVVRTYGYVKNVTWQILQLMERAPDQVRGKAFYVGDQPGDIYEWTNTFSLALTGKAARRIPRIFLWSVAMTGSALSSVGLSFPITLSRYKSMTTDYATPITATRDIVGKAPYDLEKGVEETVQWLTPDR